MRNSEATQLKEQETDRLDTPTGLSQDAVAKISDCLRQLLADVFALYLKTKNFHWHISGSTSASTICCWTSTRRKSSR
jgi:starvation-inducible DNA-binding protein